MSKIFITLNDSVGRKIWLNVDAIDYLRTKYPVMEGDFEAIIYLRTRESVLVKETYDEVVTLILEVTE